MSWSANTAPQKKTTRLQSALWLLLALVCVTITCSLGFWQLGRAKTKLDWQAEIAQKGQLPALAGTFLGGPQDSATNRAGLLHRPIHLNGEWLEKYTIYLDNRQMNARPGFYVMTPLKLQETGAVVLVQRGWVGRDFTDRNRLPPIQTPTGSVAVNGLIALPPPSFMPWVQRPRPSYGKMSTCKNFVLRLDCLCWKFQSFKWVQPPRVCCVNGRRPQQVLRNTTVMPSNGLDWRF